MQKIIRIISRNSQLAMWQTYHVRDKIIELYPDTIIEVIGITTKGDKILDKSLDKIGGKGLFIKELELALIKGIADIAVHSLKDLPANLSSGFKIAAVLEREDASDAFVSNNYTSLENMSHGAIIGTASARRMAILNKYFPHLHVKLLRGNIITRLTKLDNNEYDAIILAVAGLKRLGLETRITKKLDQEKFVPAIGQGALAIEILDGNKDLLKMIMLLGHNDTNLLVSTEREVGRLLQANCSVPIAVHATFLGEQLILHAIIMDKDTNFCCESVIVSPKEDYLKTAAICVRDLLMQGAASILQKYN